jgi:hypothetical protein
MLYGTVLRCGAPKYAAWQCAVLCLLCCMLTRLTPHGRSSLSCGLSDIVFCVVCDMFQLPSLYLSQAAQVTNNSLFLFTLPVVNFLQQGGAIRTVSWQQQVCACVLSNLTSSSSFIFITSFSILSFFLPSLSQLIFFSSFKSPCCPLPPSSIIVCCFGGIHF